MIEIHFESIPQFSLQLYIFFDNLHKTKELPASLTIFHSIYRLNRQNSTLPFATTLAPPFVSRQPQITRTLLKVITKNSSSYLAYPSYLLSATTTTTTPGLPANLFDQVTVSSRRLGIYNLQIFQLVNILISSLAISHVSSSYYFSSLSGRIKLYKFIAYILQFTSRFMINIFLFRIWGWPIFAIGLIQLLIDFMHIFKHNGDQLLKFPFLSVFNLITLCCHKKIVSSEKYYKRFSICLIVVYFFENLTLCGIFYFCFKEFNQLTMQLFTSIFAVAFLVALFFELLAIFNFNVCCCKIEEQNNIKNNDNDDDF